GAAEQSGNAIDDDELLAVRYRAVLALARAGDNDRAAAMFDEFGFGSWTPVGEPASLVEDIRALAAKLAKNRTIAATGEARRQRASEAAQLYEDIYHHVGRPYSCINAATMWLLAGDSARSRDLAADALELCDQIEPAGPDDAYWLAATRAEAALLLGNLHM